MSEVCENMISWAEQGENLVPVKWDSLPEIYLYMDQVITYMHSQLFLFERKNDTRLLTSSMINNYVKDGVLERPEKKKYNRNHLASLMVICMLKQVLSIQDISALLKPDLTDEYSRRALYENFSQAQTAALHEVCPRIKSAAADGEEALRSLAMELSVEANALRAAAERIVSELENSQTLSEENK